MMKRDMDSAEAVVGYTRIDDKGRVSLGKPMRAALGLNAGASMAYVKVGDAIMLIPQDAHLTEVMENATRALERARISVDDLMDSLTEARAEVVVEHYGEEFLRELERIAEQHPIIDAGD
jgi:bifunctional DNA-binding transcriptional regulator/antitoxin component of YhaV-PrlF toxin-antitoxin module